MIRATNTAILAANEVKEMEKNKKGTKEAKDAMEELLERLECGTAMLWVFYDAMAHSIFGADDYSRAMYGMWNYMTELTEKFRALTCADAELDKAAQT